jgi:hypothetical protein
MTGGTDADQGWREVVTGTCCSEAKGLSPCGTGATGSACKGGEGPRGGPQFVPPEGHGLGLVQAPFLAYTVAHRGVLGVRPSGSGG